MGIIDECEESNEDFCADTPLLEEECEQLRDQLRKDKVHYLVMVQAIIARMSNYSAAIKGCCCAVIAGLFVLFFSGMNQNIHVIYSSLLVVIICALFSFFDMKYLQLERQYRDLYKTINENFEGTFKTDLKPPPPTEESRSKIGQVYFTWSVFGFYSALFIITILSLIVTLYS